MAQVHNNIFVRGLSGAVGDQFVIRRTRSGKTIIANKPQFDPDREFSPAQKTHQQAFREASAYARSVKRQPLYVERAKALNSTSYNVAIADWFGKPEILDIDASGWTGEVGQEIHIRARDNVMVADVSVTIAGEDGAVYEEGQAIRAEGDELLWVYTTTRAVSLQPAPRVTVTARDLPGNSVSREGIVKSRG